MSTIEYKTEATPRENTPDNVPVFCSYDKVVAVKELKPNPGNPNKHNAKQIAMLADIIKGTGWRAPITVSNRSGYIVKGHGRRQAAIVGGLKYVPVEYQDYASAAEEHADLIADNRIAELAEIDTGKLMDMIQEMDTGELPVEMTGYSSEDLAEILDSMEGTDDSTADGADDVPDTDDEVPPFTKEGDLWHLGKHKLLCGSATSEDDIDRLMDGEQAQLVHTDPPYGVSFVGSGRGANKFGMIKNDDKTHDDLMKDLLVPAFKNYVRYTADDAAFYIWYATSTGRDFEDAMTAVGLMQKQQLIWVKNNFVLGHNDYHWVHEPCLYAEKCGHKAKWYGDRSQTTAWKVVLRASDGVATTLTGGVVLTDGKGNKLVLTEKTTKGKKMRYIRLSEGKSVLLYNEKANGTVWEIDKDVKAMHPTQKPVEIPIRAIMNSSDNDDIVLDFFGGSGSTLIACEMTGRRCRSTELDPKYCDVAVKRYIEMAGKGAITCERDGKEYSYDEIVDEYIREHPDIEIN